ncbi:MAG TPA: fumarylacetoacetate hydrolase family protein [Acidimicrobiia bacterium]|jgi:2-keto-4-pentenoate hydratase
MTTDARAVAETLYKAARTCTPIPPLTDTNPDMTVADAYAVQSELVDMLLDEGDRVVGYKLGLTSEPMQKLLGVDEPDYAPIFASGLVDDGGSVEVGQFIQLKAEAEIALLLDRPLTGPGVTLEDATRAVGGAMAAIEIVDSRIEDWKIKLPDTIADLASSGAVVLSSRLVPVDDFDVRLVGMVVTKNGQLMGTGAGAAALGNPVAAVAWLANTLGPYGVTLEAGRFVMTGALHAAFPAQPGDVVRADFDRLGAVSVRMT